MPTVLSLSKKGFAQNFLRYLRATGAAALVRTAFCLCSASNQQPEYQAPQVFN